jgi:peptide/nickel transport system substrate-binding protein
MKRESLGLYLLRFLLNLAFFGLILMVYWSSLLQEEDIKSIKLTVEQLRNDFLTLQEQRKSIPTSINQEETKEEAHFSDKIDSSLPNLLSEDPFYETTLPKMLGPNFRPRGIRLGAIVARPANLHPFSNWSNVVDWVSQCTTAVSTSKFGRYETFAPEAAFRMEERPAENSKDTEFWLFLRNDIFWEPLSTLLFADQITLAPHFLKKHQVTAHDFKFYFDAMMNPYVQEAGAVALRNYFSAVEEVRVVDDFTLAVRWKAKEIPQPDGTVVPKIKYAAKLWTGALRPLASFLYKYFPDGTKIIEDDSDPNTYRTNSIWAQNFALHWAKNIIPSCGSWVFNGMSEYQIRFKRNVNYFLPLAVLVDGLEIEFRDTPDAIWQDFKAAKIDAYEVQPNQIIEFEEFLKSPEYKAQAAIGLAIRRLDFPARMYSYIGWNEAKSYFKSKNVRRALTMAIDRKRIIQKNLNGMGIETTGTFYRYSPAYDPSIEPWPYDPIAARRILEEEGWFDSDGDGILDKMIDGISTPFRFGLTYYVKNPTAKSISEYVCTALKEIGIACYLNGVDIADLSATFDDKSFDALFLSWGLGTPPEDPRQLWHSLGAKEKGSSNAIGFANAEVDEIIDKLDYEYDPKKRIELYHRFDTILHVEAPYTFLYMPKVAFAYREYLQNVFIPADRQDLIPGANVAEPQSSVFWLKKNAQLYN